MQQKQNSILLTLLRYLALKKECVVISEAEYASLQYVKALSPQKETAVTLSPAELRLAPLLLKGFQNKDIANILNLSVHTINNHLENMKEKTGCRNKPELILYILKNGIVD